MQVSSLLGCVCLYSIKLVNKYHNNPKKNKGAIYEKNLI